MPLFNDSYGHISTQPTVLRGYCLALSKEMNPFEYCLRDLKLCLLGLLGQLLYQDQKKGGS